MQFLGTLPVGGSWLSGNVCVFKKKITKQCIATHRKDETALKDTEYFPLMELLLPAELSPILSIILKIFRGLKGCFKTDYKKKGKEWSGVLGEYPYGSHLVYILSSLQVIPGLG